ncbi:MAG: transglutaminase family protein [Cytophagales bacterium]|nr:transglutaminase family protein [Armatimonadota bacterium]
MQLSLSATADYDLPRETFLLLMVEPRLKGEAHEVLQESLRTSPTPYAELASDGLGNPLRRLIAPPGLFTFDFAATVETPQNRAVPDSALEHAPRDLPPSVLVYTLPSRYCQSDQLARLALGEFGSIPQGGTRVRAIADWVRTHVEYQYGTTDALTSAYDTAVQRVGVCRDFAHLTIAFCRALGIPARYVSGYCLDLDPPDFHGWTQVFLGGAWHNVDSTFQGVRPALVPIAYGRDAADVSLLTLWGNNTFRAQSVSVQRIY